MLCYEGKGGGDLSSSDLGGKRLFFEVVRLLCEPAPFRSYQVYYSTVDKRAILVRCVFICAC